MGAGCDAAVMPTEARPRQGLTPSNLTMAVDASRRSTSSGGLLQLSSISPILRPVFRAYAFGYASAVGPRLLTLILQRLSRRKRRRLSQGRDDDTASFRSSALHIVRTGFDLQRFPTFCAVLAGGSTLLLVRRRQTPHNITYGVSSQNLGSSKDNLELYSKGSQNIYEDTVIGSLSNLYTA